MIIAGHGVSHRHVMYRGLVTLFHRNQAYVRQGHWKITQVETPFDAARFGLYDLVVDPGETTDFSQKFPEKRLELIELWHQQRLQLGVTLPGDLWNSTVH